MLIQPTFVISDSVAAGLATRELYRSGGVIRKSATGEIVEHLKDAVPKDFASNKVAISETAKATNVAIAKGTTLSLGGKIAVGTLIVAGLVAVGYGSYRLIMYIKNQSEIKQHKETNQDSNDILTYNPQLTKYFNNIQTKKMTLSSVKKVIEFFEKYSNGELAIEISDEEMLVIRNIIVRYTIKLCEINKISVDNKHLSIQPKTKINKNLLDDIVYATKFQQRIFS